MSTTSHICLITGATSGIGLATAQKLASHNYTLILCGRRQERLKMLSDELSTKARIITLCFDVADKKAAQASLDRLPPDIDHIDVLINNAGNAHGLAPIQVGDPNDWDAMIDSNIRGLLYVTHATMPRLLKSAHGHIINIGSIAAKEIYPNGNVYCATKAAVDALTTGMRIDLNGQGIKVSAIHPGMVKTEFSNVRFKGDQERAEKTYEGMTPLFPQDIADIIWMVINTPPHVNIADLLVLPTAQADIRTVRRTTTL